MAVLTLAPPNLVDGQAFDTLGDALLYLRVRFQSYREIVTLADLRIEGDHPWREAIERRLAEFLDDLGNCPMDSWTGAKHTISHGDLLTKCPNSSILRNAHPGRPAICLAAGPSAAQYWPHIQQLKKTHFIFTCDSLLDGCLAHGVIPDYTCMIERDAHMAKFTTRGNCGTYLVAPPVIHPDCVRPFAERIMWWLGADDLYKWLGPYDRAASGRSAGTMSIAAALWAGCDPIYLVGHDLAYTNGQTHTADTHDFAREIQARDDARPPNGNYYLEQFHVEQNGGGTVRSNGLWSLFKGDIEALLMINQGRRVINVNRDVGAVIHGAEIGDFSYEKRPLVPMLFWKAGGITDPRTRIPSILADLERVKTGAKQAISSLLEGVDAVKLKANANKLTISSLVSEVNQPLFRYVFRSVYDSLMLRIHLRISEGRTDDESMATVQAILTETLSAMAWRMEEDLQCLRI